MLAILGRMNWRMTMDDELPLPDIGPLAVSFAP